MAARGRAVPTSRQTAPVDVPQSAPLGAPGVTIPWSFQPGSPVQARIDTSRVLARVTVLHFGNNLNWWARPSWLVADENVDKAIQAGIRFWRWPGGSSSDNYHWDGNYGDHVVDHEGKDTLGMHGLLAAKSADYVEFCKRTKSTGIVTVNYGMARYWDVGRASDLAARWVRFFNVEHGLGIKYWEIGNETYGLWEEGNSMPNRPRLTGTAYGRDFRVIAGAMKKVDPDILVGAPAVAADGGDEWHGHRFWMRDMLPEIADAADFLVLHDYFVWPYQQGGGLRFVSADEIFASVSQVSEHKQAVDRMVARYTHRSAPWPLLLTEFNVVNASTPETIALVSGLFTAEVVAEAIRAGYAGANLWDWNNGFDHTLGGDHGTLALGDPDVPDGTPRPSYYALALYARAFGDTMVSSSSEDPRVKVYASQHASGESGLVVVNEKPEPISIHLRVLGRSLRGTARAWVLDGADPTAKRVRWNGHEGPSGGGGPFPLGPIPPYAARFDPRAPVIIDLPPSSASGVVLD